MSANFRLDTKGGREIELKLGALVAAFGDLTPLMDGFGNTLEGSVLNRFETETAPDGSRWTPSLRARIDGGKTLQKSSQLVNSRTHVAGADSVEVGTNKIYAGVHQFGATIRAKTAKGLQFQLPGKLGFRRVMEVEIPARPFLGLSSDDEAELIAQAEDYARSAIGPSAEGAA